MIPSDPSGAAASRTGARPRGARAAHLVAVVGAVILVSAACKSGGHPVAHAMDDAPTTTAPSTTPPSTTPPTTASTTTSTTAAPTTTAPNMVGPGGPISSPDGLGRGSSGPAVEQLERRLSDLGFDVGAIDGRFDRALYFAVVAFQKQQDLPRTGRADQNTLNVLANAKLGAPMLPTAEPTRIEIDLKRQLLQYWVDGRLTRVLPVSTGTGKRYCVPEDKGGGCDYAVTPGGSFRVDRKIEGLRVSKLGELWNPIYFNGGIAIHGSPSVPPSPASHGCVRIPMNSSMWMFNSVQIGTPVYVLGGKTAPVPFNEKAPADAGATTSPSPGGAPPSTTPTTAPPPSSTTTTSTLVRRPFGG